MATRRPRSQSSARTNDDIAPAPSRRITRKRSATSLSSSDTVSICPLAPAQSRGRAQARERRADRGRDLDRAAALAVDADVDEPARRGGLVARLGPEQRDLVADARAAEVADAQ